MATDEDVRKALEDAREKGWLSPLKVLSTQMSADEREEIRASLEFKFEPENRGSAVMEAWEIIDTPRMGMIARFHSLGEMVEPGFNITWQSALKRVLEWAKVTTVRGTNSEKLERKLTEFAAEKHFPEVAQSNGIDGALKALASAIKLAAGESANVVDAVELIDGLIDLIGSFYKKSPVPAVDAMFAICLTKHAEPLDPSPPVSREKPPARLLTKKPNLRLPKPRNRQSS